MRALLPNGSLLKWGVVVILVGVFATSSPVSSAAFEKLKTISVIGTGDVYRDSISAARERAIQGSLMSAVKSAAAEVLSIDAIVTHFPTINAILFEKPGEYVQDYKVLTEHKFGRKYRVLVQATVMIDRLVEQLSSVGIIVEAKLLPKILLFHSEQNPENTWPLYWWSDENSFGLITAGEQALVESLVGRGFTVIERAFPMPVADIEPVYYKPILTDSEASRIGIALDAEVVIVGKSVARDALNAMGDNLQSFKGIVSARAIRTDTGENIAVTEQSALSVNIDELAGGRSAISAAGTLAAEDLAAQIVRAWHRETISPEMVEMVVTGTGNLAAFVKFRKTISATPDVNGIRVKELKVNEAVIVVDYEKDADELASILVLNDFETFGVDITEVTSGHLSVEIITPPADQ